MHSIIVEIYCTLAEIQSIIAGMHRIITEMESIVAKKLDVVVEIYCILAEIHSIIAEMNKQKSLKGIVLLEKKTFFFPLTCRSAD